MGSDTAAIERHGPVISNNLFTTLTTTLTHDPSVHPADLQRPRCSTSIRLFILSLHRCSLECLALPLPSCPSRTFHLFSLLVCVVGFVATLSRRGLFNITASPSFHYQRWLPILAAFIPSLAACMDTLSPALVALLSMSAGRTQKSFENLCHVQGFENLKEIITLFLFWRGSMRTCVHSCRVWILCGNLREYTHCHFKDIIFISSKCCLLFLNISSSSLFIGMMYLRPSVSLTMSHSLSLCGQLTQISN